jgi:hypothetical protein
LPASDASFCSLAAASHRARSGRAGAWPTPRPGAPRARPRDPRRRSGSRRPCCRSRRRRTSCRPPWRSPRRPPRRTPQTDEPDLRESRQFSVDSRQ